MVLVVENKEIGGQADVAFILFEIILIVTPKRVTVYLRKEP